MFLQLTFFCLPSVSCFSTAAAYTSTTHSSSCSGFSINAGYVCSNVLFIESWVAETGWWNTISPGVCERKYFEMWWLWQKGLVWLKWETTPSTTGFMPAAQRIYHVWQSSHRCSSKVTWSEKCVLSCSQNLCREKMSASQSDNLNRNSCSIVSNTYASYHTRIRSWDIEQHALRAHSYK